MFVKKEFERKFMNKSNPKDHDADPTDQEVQRDLALIPWKNSNKHI